MSHANARLNEYGRTLAVERYLAGQKVRDIAGQLGVSRTTVYKWVARYALEGPAGLTDRSSRPHHSPRQVRLEVELQVLQARLDLHAATVGSTAPDSTPGGNPRQLASEVPVPEPGTSIPSSSNVDQDLWAFLDWLLEQVGPPWTREALGQIAAIYRIPEAGS